MGPLVAWVVGGLPATGGAGRGGLHLIRHLPGSKLLVALVLTVLLTLNPASVGASEHPSPVYANVIMVEDLGCGPQTFFSGVDLRIELRHEGRTLLDERIPVWPEAVGLLTGPVDVSPGSRLSVHVSEEEVGQYDAEGRICDVAPGPELNHTFVYEGPETIEIEGDDASAVRAKIHVGHEPPERPVVGVDWVAPRSASLTWTPGSENAEDTVRLVGVERHAQTLPATNGTTRFDDLLDNRSYKVAAERSLGPWIVSERTAFRTPDVQPRAPSLETRRLSDGNLSVTIDPPTPHDIQGFTLYAGQGPSFPLDAAHRWGRLTWSEHGRDLRLYAPVLPSWIEQEAPLTYEAAPPGQDTTHIRVLAHDLAGHASPSATAHLDGEQTPQGQDQEPTEPDGGEAEDPPRETSGDPWVTIGWPRYHPYELRPHQAIRGSAGGVNHGAPIVHVRVDQGPWTKVPTELSNARHETYSWRFQLDPEIHAYGEHEVQARASTDEGSSSTTSQTVMLTNRSAANPPARILMAQDIIGWRVNSTVDVSGSRPGSLNGSGAYIEVRAPGTPSWTRVGPGAPWTYAWNTTGLTPGEHVVEVRGFDGRYYTDAEAWTYTLREARDRDHPEEWNWTYELTVPEPTAGQRIEGPFKIRLVAHTGEHVRIERIRWDVDAFVTGSDGELELVDRQGDEEVYEATVDLPYVEPNVYNLTISQFLRVSDPIGPGTPDPPGRLSHPIVIPLDLRIPPPRPGVKIDVNETPGADPIVKITPWDTGKENPYHSEWLKVVIDGARRFSGPTPFKLGLDELPPGEHHLLVVTSEFGEPDFEQERTVHVQEPPSEPAAKSPLDQGEPLSSTGADRSAAHKAGDQGPADRGSTGAPSWQTPVLVAGLVLGSAAIVAGAAAWLGRR